MSKFRVDVPLFLARAQSEALGTPLQDAAATGETSLDTEQQAVTLGEPVPIIFCRRVDGVGGVLASPKATEGRYSNNLVNNDLTVRLELVLSEGELPLLQLRDVFQRACRVGTWAQAYNARAGTWDPGNIIVPLAGTTPWNCPYYCGTSGSYENLTTLSYTNIHSDGDENWSKQVHAFVRQGMQVTRIIDSTYGPSNNFIDLALYLIAQTNRVPSTLIDSAAMLTAAQFTNTNGLLFNGIVQTSTNLEEWLYSTSSGFLLRFCDRAGKKILKPRLPINNDFTIKTTAITAEYQFSENDLLPNGFEIDYVPLEQRLPACIVVLWRQQPDDDIGIIRTTEVRFAGEAPNGPYEQYDLSEYCASENHAVKVGTYYAARRKYITHSLRIQVRPGAYNSTLELGDIVRVQLARETDVSDYAIHDYYYEVDRITKSTTGVVTLDLTHFPIDEQNRSLVALKVAEAVGAGYTMPTGRSDFSCDLAGRRTDTSTIPNTPDPDPPVIPDPDNFEYEIPEATVTTNTTPITFGPDNATIPGTRNRVLSSSGASSPSGTTSNPADPVETVPPAFTGITGENGHPLHTDTLGIAPPCPNGKVTWYKRFKGTGEREFIKEETISGSGSGNFSITTDEIDYAIEADTQCPDSSAVGGYGSPITSVTPTVYPNRSSYTHVRWEGTLTIPGSGTTSYTSNWFATNIFSEYLTVNGLYDCLPPTGPWPGDDVVSGSSTGPVAWRASVGATQKVPGAYGGQYSIGGISVDGVGAGCGATAPNISFSANLTTVGSWSIRGKWQFANLVSGNYVLGASWEGVPDTFEVNE